MPWSHQPGASAGSWVLGKTELAVEHEQLFFSCDAVAQCRFEARYTIHNPTPAAIEAMGAFYGHTERPIEIALDGVDVRAPLSLEQRDAADVRVRSLDPKVQAADLAAVVRTGYRVRVDGGAAGTLVFRGDIAAVKESTGAGDYVWPAAESRHPIVGEPARHDAVAFYRYLVSPLRDWAKVPIIDVVVEVDGGHDVYVDSEGVLKKHADVVGGRRRIELQVDPNATSDIVFQLVQSPRQFLRGGPVLALGARVNGIEPRLRVGYEMAWPHHVLYALAAETAGFDEVMLVPTVELATPQLLVIPSLGIALGAPVRLLDATHGFAVGARVQATASFFFGSVVVPVDWYPSDSSDGLRVAVLLQASL